MAWRQGFSRAARSDPAPGTTPGTTLAPLARAMKTRVILCSVVVLGVISACQQNPEDDLMSAPPPPPAAMIAPITETMPLEDRLQQLQHELDMALIRGQLDEETTIRLYRAEAITDRILESQVPYEWLAERYDLSARLRQLQSLADRVVAKIRREEEPELILADAMRLRRVVIDLRESIAAQGGEAPIPLEVLLAGGGEDYDEYPPGGRPDAAGAGSDGDDDSAEPPASDAPATASEPSDDGPRVLGRPVDG